VRKARALRAAFWGKNTLILQGADRKVCVIKASRAAAEDDMIDNGVLVLIIRAS
jgi:hypothetical protein